MSPRTCARSSTTTTMCFRRAKFVAFAGTNQAFAARAGAPKKFLFRDACSPAPKPAPEGAPPGEFPPPAAKYGLRIRALSPHIKAIQIYAPPDKNFVAVEPQF